MLEALLQFSIRRRWLVLVLTFGAAALGAYHFRHLPIDAVPDITNVQVQINTEAPGFSPSSRSNASPSPLRPPSPVSRASITRAPSPATASPKSPSSSKTAPISTSPASSSPSVSKK